ncbi:MAG TPA: hypothetical protein VF941_01370 [Clostridia bacterium]
MFNLVKGVNVKNLDGIYESYKVQNTKDFCFISVNVSAEKIGALFKELCSYVRTPGFLVIEVPTNANIEKEIRKNDTDSFHNDAYYIDGQSYEDIAAIFDKYSELLINDGFVKFGFGSHSGYDEIFVVDYKIFHIYADEPQKYLDVLERYEIKKKEDYKTVWENFSPESPGSSMSIHIDGCSIYDMVEELKGNGLYFAERRERK